MSKPVRILPQNTAPYLDYLCRCRAPDVTTSLLLIYEETHAMMDRGPCLLEVVRV